MATINRFDRVDNDVQNAIILDYLSTVSRATRRQITSKVFHGFTTDYGMNYVGAALRRLERIGAIRKNGSKVQGWWVQTYWSITPKYMNWHTIKEGRND